MALLSQSGETGKCKEAVSDLLQTANRHIPRCIRTSSYIFKTTSQAVLSFGMVFLCWIFFYRSYVCIDSSLSKQFKWPKNKTRELCFTVCSSIFSFVGDTISSVSWISLIKSRRGNVLKDLIRMQKEISKY